jgi:hypothetical protein
MVLMMVTIKMFYFSMSLEMLAASKAGVGLDSMAASGVSVRQKL